MALPTEEQQRISHKSDKPVGHQMSQEQVDSPKKDITIKAPLTPGSGKLGKVSQLLINVSFVVALLLSSACLVFSAVYLFKFLASTNESISSTIQSIGTNATPGAVEVSINGRLVMGRIALLSCGILVGISFGFLGFALLLLGIKESIDVDLDVDTYKAKFARMSPGVLIIICSSILTGVCATRETPFWYEHSTGNPGYSEKTTSPNEEVEKTGESNPNNDSNTGELPSRSRKLTKP